MPCTIFPDDLTGWSEIFGIATPIIVLLWFFYSRWMQQKIEYYKEETTPGMVGGPNAVSQIVQASINFTTGKLSFRWNVKPFKTRSPLLWKSNRNYNGEMKTLNRLDVLTDKENDILERVY